MYCKCWRHSKVGNFSANLSNYFAGSNLYISIIPPLHLAALNRIIERATEFTTLHTPNANYIISTRTVSIIVNIVILSLIFLITHL